VRKPAASLQRDGVKRSVASEASTRGQIVIVGAIAELVTTTDRRIGNVV